MVAVLSAALLDILVCPVCHQSLAQEEEDADAGNTPPKGALAKNKPQEWLRCRGCGLCYPIQDGIPVMLEERATLLFEGPR
jgi:uncharacterized protein YbaR (Trm112 family)